MVDMGDNAKIPNVGLNQTYSSIYLKGKLINSR